MFTIESKFYQFSRALYRMVLTNLLFVIVSLPIVTFPAAFAALVTTLSNENEYRIVYPYFRQVKKNLLRTVPLGLFNLFSILFYLSIYQMVATSLFIRLILWVFVGFLFTYNINLYYIQTVSEQPKNYFQLFQWSFFFTSLTFYKELVVLLIFTIFYFVLFSYLPVVVYLLGISAPIYFYVKTVKRSLVKMNLIEES